jgi:hypothetical protein
MCPFCFQFLDLPSSGTEVYNNADRAILTVKAQLGVRANDQGSVCLSVVRNARANLLISANVIVSDEFNGDLFPNVWT